MKKGLVAGVIVIGFLAVLFFAGSTTSKQTNSATKNEATALSAFTAPETFYDFGAISMAAGNVSYATTIKNTSAAPVTVTRLYTSCMCTTGTLEVGNKKLGPFGMPGHGGAGIVNTNEALAPGEEATLKITFDPAAHGPAGVGFIERVITVETNAGAPLELAFTATVTP